MSKPLSEMSLDELRQSEAPDCFAELAHRLANEESTRVEAREVCFRGLTKHPDHARGRLILAKLFYLDSMPAFSYRELLELRKVSDVPSVERLLAAFGDYRHAIEPTEEQETTGVIAELDFDTEFADILAELDEVE